MANSAFLLHANQHDDQTSSDHPLQPEQSGDAQSTRADISNQCKDNLSGMSCIRHAMITSGLPVDATDIIMASWRASTQLKYSVYIKRWLSFCEVEGINYLLASPQEDTVI